MTSAWYAVVFLVGIFLGSLVRSGQVSELKKELADYKETYREY